MNSPLNIFKLTCAAVAMTAALTLAPNVADAKKDTLYYTYDTDGDGFIEETEYVQYTYDVIDYDNEDGISTDEWDTYTTVWYEPYDSITYNTERDFEYYDTDGDGVIEAVEYEKAYDNSFFTAWDKDGDGFIEYTEYQTLPTVYENYDTDNVYTW